MARILITSGPTREHLDPVRFLTNGSSGRMGAALTEAALAAGHEAIVVSGPVTVNYPKGATVIPVVSTAEMLDACLAVFPTCDGMIAVAAPCDYRPGAIAPQKIHKTGEPLVLELMETPDIVARLAEIKTAQWMVAFALETEDRQLRAMEKLRRKRCDLIVVNGPAAMHAEATSVEVLDLRGTVVAEYSGDKPQVAGELFTLIQQALIDARSGASDHVAKE